MLDNIILKISEEIFKNNIIHKKYNDIIRINRKILYNKDMKIKNNKIITKKKNKIM